MDKQPALSTHPSTSNYCEFSLQAIIPQKRIMEKESEKIACIALGLLNQSKSERVRTTLSRTQTAQKTRRTSNLAHISAQQCTRNPNHLLHLQNSAPHNFALNPNRFLHLQQK